LAILDQDLPYTDLSFLAVQAVKVTLYVLDKATGGALEKAGVDIVEFLKVIPN